jgi:hypothetical protein
LALVLGLVLLVAVVVVIGYMYYYHKPTLLIPEIFEVSKNESKKTFGHILGMTPILPEKSDFESIDNERKRDKLAYVSKRYTSRKRPHYNPRQSRTQQIESLIERKFRMNENLKILPNAGAGDCLFLCYRKMLMEAGIDAQVKELRSTVSDSITEDNFKFLHDVYNNARKQREYGLLRDYGFMNGVESVDDLKRVVMSRAYFGDEMSLTALEKRYNIGCIVIRLTRNGSIELAKRYEEKDFTRDDTLYGLLLLDENVTHYELLELDGNAIKKFCDLPLKIQRLTKVR